MNLIKSLESLIGKQTKLIQKPKQWNQKKFNEILNQSRYIVNNSFLKKSKDILKKKEILFHSNKFDKLFLHPKIGFFFYLPV